MVNEAPIQSGGSAPTGAVADCAKPKAIRQGVRSTHGASESRLHHPRIGHARLPHREASLSGLPRVELQAEVRAPREHVWALISTPVGLARWLDAADLDPTPGGQFRFLLRDAIAEGTVAAVDPPQHISFRWDWPDDPIGVPSVVALDVIDHGERAHITLRHVGFRSTRQRELHAALWRHWFARLADTASSHPESRAEPGR